MAAGLGDSLSCLSRGGDPPTANAISLHQPDEIGVEQTGGLVPPVVKEFLPLAHHPQVTIVEESDAQGQLFLDHGAQLLSGHLETTVAHDGPDLLVGPGDLGADGRWQPKAHRP